MGYDRGQNQVDASDSEINKMSELVTEANAGASDLVPLELSYIEIFMENMFLELRLALRR